MPKSSAARRRVPETAHFETNLWSGWLNTEPSDERIALAIGFLRAVAGCLSAMSYTANRGRTRVYLTPGASCVRVAALLMFQAYELLESVVLGDSDDEGWALPIVSSALALESAEGRRAFRSMNAAYAAREMAIGASMTLEDACAIHERLLTLARAVHAANPDEVPASGTRATLSAAHRRAA